MVELPVRNPRWSDPPTLPSRNPNSLPPPIPKRSPPPVELSFDDLIPLEMPAQRQAQKVNVNTGISFDDLIPQAQASELPTQEAEQQQPSFNIDFNASPKDVRTQIAKLPRDQRKAALRQWADVYVAKERAEAGDGNYVSDTIRNLARGTPVGSWLDEANASTQSAIHQLTGGFAGAPYEETLAYQRALDRASDAESTTLATLPVVGDVTVGGATKLAGGIASVPALPVANIARGTTFVPSAINTGATAAGYGALYGSGEGDAVQDRVVNAAFGAALGGTLGVGGEAVGRVLGGVASKAQSGPDLPVINGQKISPQASDLAYQAFRNDFAADTAGAARRYNVKSAQLGQRGMLADMGDNLTGLTGAIAGEPGRGQTIVKNALSARQKLGQRRINDAVDDSLGTPANLPELTKHIDDNAKRLAQPHLDEFYQTFTPITQEIGNTLKRAYALIPSLEKGVMRMLKAKGADLQTTGSNSRIISQVKKSLHNYASMARDKRDYDGANTAEMLANTLKRQVDEAISPGNPGRSPWAKARTAIASSRQFEKGLSEGKGFLDSKTTADEFRFNFRNLSDLEREGVRMQARHEIRQKMGGAQNAFANQASAAASKGRRILSSEDARAKLREIVGPEISKTLTRVLDAEGVMASTINKAVGGSPTAARVAARYNIAPYVKNNNSTGELGKKSMVGIAMETFARVGRHLVNTSLDERGAQIIEEVALVLTQKGVKKDQIAKALLEAARKQGASDAKMKEIRSFIRTAVIGGTPAAIDRQK